MKIKQHKESGLWVTDDGRVVMPPTGGNFKKFRFTYGCKDKKGYMVVKYRGKIYKVHRLVAETHISNPEGYPTVDHYPDRTPSNNAASNLRWASYRLQNNNRQICEDSLARYGVRECEDQNAYKRARRVKDPEFAERERARCREWEAKQRSLGKRRRKCPDGKQHLLTDEEYEARFGNKSQ